jgi:hypothetical protein
VAAFVIANTDGGGNNIIVIAVLQALSFKITRGAAAKFKRAKNGRLYQPGTGFA